MTSKSLETKLMDLFFKANLSSTKKVARERRFVIKWAMKRKKANKRKKLFVNEWEPLQQMKESVKDNLHDLENTTTTNKNSNTLKTKFFEKVKRNLIDTTPTFTTFDVH
jgi:hypothetical protein